MGKSGNQSKNNTKTKQDIPVKETKQSKKSDSKDGIVERVGCFCPPACLLKTQIDAAKPGNAIRFICSNKVCHYASFMHVECCDAWEQELVHIMLKNITSTRRWNEKQAYQNLWLKNGHAKIYQFCACLCGHGHLQRDIDYDLALSQAEAAAKSAVSEAVNAKMKEVKDNEQKPKAATTSSTAVTVTKKHLPPTITNKYSSYANKLMKQNCPGISATDYLSVTHFALEPIANRFGETQLTGGAAPRIIPGLSTDDAVITTTTADRVRTDSGISLDPVRSSDASISSHSTASEDGAPIYNIKRLNDKDMEEILLQQIWDLVASRGSIPCDDPAIEELVTEMDDELIFDIAQMGLTEWICSHPCFIADEGLIMLADSGRTVRQELRGKQPILRQSALPSQSSLFSISSSAGLNALDDFDEYETGDGVCYDRSNVLSTNELFVKERERFLSLETADLESTWQFPNTVNEDAMQVSVDSPIVHAHGLPLKMPEKIKVRLNTTHSVLVPKFPLSDVSNVVIAPCDYDLSAHTRLPDQNSALKYAEANRQLAELVAQYT